MRKIKVLLVVIIGVGLMNNNTGMYHLMGLVFFWLGMFLLVTGEILSMFNDTNNT